MSFRRFHQKGDAYVCKRCGVQLSAGDHFVEQDSTFIKFELMFNIAFGEPNQDLSAASSSESPFYILKCAGCGSAVGAKPVTMSDQTVADAVMCDERGP